MAHTPTGRLALREDGDFWKAYYAMPGTMDGAILLGMVRLRFARDNPTIKRDFMLLMQKAVTDTLREVTGAELVWPEPPQPAAEHERGVRPGRR
jgi:hypothetical protein